MENLKSLLVAWNSLNGPAYQVRERDMLWNLTLAGDHRYRLEDIAGVPTLTARSVDGLWASLWGEIPNGQEREFLDAVTELAFRERKEMVGLGGDEFHFVPGVPLDTKPGQRLVQKLEECGYSGRKVVDLVGDLQRSAVTASVDKAATVAAQKNWRLEEIRTASERALLGQFIEAEFAGRWSREYAFWLGQNSPCASYFVLREPLGPILGFVRLSWNSNDPESWLPGNVRLSPHEQGIGPIGVATSRRGDGAGRTLLGLALAMAREKQSVRGSQLCIDWTDIQEYYAPLEFKVVRSYQIARLFKTSRDGKRHEGSK